MFPVGYFPIRQFPLGYFPEGSSGSTLAAGSISLVSATSSTLVLLATNATGGTSPYTYQWARSISALGPFADVGTNSLSLTNSGLSASTTYYFRLTYTDGASATVTATYSASTQAEGSTDLAPITISRALTFATGGGSIGTGYGKVMQGESLAVFAQFTCSSGTLQILGTPTFTVIDLADTILVDEQPVALQSSVAASSVVIDYVMLTSDLFPDGTAITDQEALLRCWFEASLLDGNGQTQIVRCEGALRVVGAPT